MNSSDLIIEIQQLEAPDFKKDSEKIITQLVEKNIFKIQEYILDNIQNLDGGPTISNLAVVSFNYNEITNKGTFRLKFQIDRRYCCSDIDACANDYLDFEYHLQDNKLIASSEYFDWSLNN